MGNLENLIKDGWRDHKSIIVGYGYLKPFKMFKKLKKYTMKSLGPMKSWPMAINCPKKKTLVTNHMQRITYSKLFCGFLGV